MKPGLSSILQPISAEKFLKENWPDEHFVVHGLSSSNQVLTKISAFDSIDSLLKCWSGSVQAHLPDVKDESSAVNVSSADARKLFSNKMALLFNNAEVLDPVLPIWLEALRSDLGLPAMTYGRCMVYATPDGKGTAPHFDQNVNFVLQLRGTKRWSLAKNKNVINPTERYTMGQPLDPALEPYAELPMPEIMPRKLPEKLPEKLPDNLALEDSARALGDQIDYCEEVILKPGSMLFVPRGYWHSTESEGESLALNFTFTQPTWIDLFTAALRSRLTLSPEWRGLADGVSSNDISRQEFAEQELESLLAELVDDLPNWQAKDIIAATEGR
jgi:50S ribosomal protein L16 3-hydroxylase